MDEDTVMLAEQATLGALMLDPAGIDRVRGWTRPGDFADWWHSQVFTALLERHAAGETVDVEAMAPVMVDRLGERSGGRLRLVDLISVVPARPDPAVYARLVVQAGSRREVAGQGVLLRAGALQSMLSESAGPVASACLMVDATLDGLAARWAAATGHAPAPTTTPIPLRPAARPLEVRAGADKYLRARPARNQAAERDHVVTLIGSLIAHPDAIPTVATWLRPSQVPDPGWRAVYAAATDLAARGEHVDVVTVAWAAQALTEHASPAPSARQLREAADAGWFDHPGQAARIVAGEQLCALADHAATHLAGAADNPVLEVEEVIDTGHVLTNALRHGATGLPTRGVLTPSVEAPRATRGPVAG
ncbi:DnaB-like helicase N-terminal domain-containing protein [Actinotalea subterranea]|uniref:DnaB-like helicase N-terminal domain-containing protein n=1 Tax=Actinotalea subterranea TaxID=2607497 RepID=UPI0011EEBCFF|nr:DnaB-like helicase N-terminal domain-containing protein [Actinotalea subterranea]